MQRFARILTAGVLCAAPSLAQQQFDLPTLRFNPQNNNYPFAGPPMRYQQWFSAAEWRARAANPIRVVGCDFFAGPGRTGIGGRQIDIEVSMANAPPTSYSSVFDSNHVSGHVVVLPRRMLTLSAPSGTTPPVRISFVNEFVWDGTSGVVLDVRLHDNGNNNQAYTYDLEYLAFTQGRTARLYTPNNPFANQAQTVQAGTGLTTRFYYDEAIAWPYGLGCAGEGRIVPEHGVDGGLPIPGNTAYGMTLSRAASQRNALFFLGFSDANWGSLALPYDLGGVGATGCWIRAEPFVSATVPTVGGGAGSGIARFGFPMPPTNDYLGIPFFTQWVVLDPNAPNGLLSATNAIKHIPARR